MNSNKRYIKVDSAVFFFLFQIFPEDFSNVLFFPHSIPEHSQCIARFLQYAVFCHSFPENIFSAHFSFTVLQKISPRHCLFFCHSFTVLQFFNASFSVTFFRKSSPICCVSVTVFYKMFPMRCFSRHSFPEDLLQHYSDSALLSAAVPDVLFPCLFLNTILLCATFTHIVTFPVFFGFKIIQMFIHPVWLYSVATFFRFGTGAAVFV